MNDLLFYLIFELGDLILAFLVLGLHVLLEGLELAA
jgi:hypothetical protein